MFRSIKDVLTEIMAITLFVAAVLVVALIAIGAHEGIIQ